MCNYSFFEFFTDSLKNLLFLNSRESMTGVELGCLNLSCKFQTCSSFYVCHKKVVVHGMRLACSLSLSILGCAPLPFMDILRPTKSYVKSDIKELVCKLWHDEWISTESGSKTRAFFPSPESAKTLVGRVLSFQVTQIVTGHSRLNQHQHRFKFTDSALCSCGADVESVEHFLFHCKLYSSQRQIFKAVSARVTEVWPPVLADIPQVPVLWSAMCKFIVATKRLLCRPVSRPR